VRTDKTTDKMMEMLELGIEMGHRWAEVDADSIDGKVPAEPPPATVEDALGVIRDFGLPIFYNADRAVFDAMPAEVRACAALLCLEARKERWMDGFIEESPAPMSEITNVNGVPANSNFLDDEGLDPDGERA